MSERSQCANWNSEYIIDYNYRLCVNFCVVLFMFFTVSVHVWQTWQNTIKMMLQRSFCLVLPLQKMKSPLNGVQTTMIAFWREKAQVETGMHTLIYEYLCDLSLS